MISKKDIESMSVEDIKKYVENLQNDIDKLEQSIKEKTEELSIIKSVLSGQVETKKISVSRDKICVFNEAELVQNHKVAEPDETSVLSSENNKSKKNHNSSGLTEVVVNMGLPDEYINCNRCGKEMTRKGKRFMYKEFGIKNESLALVSCYLYDYECENCAGEDGTYCAISIEDRNRLFKNSYVSPAVAAHIMNYKYDKGISLERQEKILKKKNIYLSKEAMANWIIRVADKWLRLIYRQMRRALLASDVIYASKTDVMTLDDNGKKYVSDHKMYVYSTDKRSGNPIHIFEYQSNKWYDNPETFLKKFKGFLVSNGDEEYIRVKGAVHCGSWEYLSSKWNKLASKGSVTDKLTAMNALKYCDELVNLEKQCRRFNNTERMYSRRNREEVILDRYFLWLKSLDPKENSVVKEVVDYSMNNEKQLRVFIDYGEIEIHNGIAEKAINPFVPGGKAWVFNDTDKGAKTSAVIYSIMETARANGFKPHDYLYYVLSMLKTMGKNISNAELDNLMPWNEYIKDDMGREIY